MVFKSIFHGRRTILAAAILLSGLPTLAAPTSFAPIGKANVVIDAVRNNGADRVGDATAAKPEDIDRADALGRTALHYAASLGRTEAVAILLDAGAEPDRVDNDGYTPLMRAVQSGHTGVVALLLPAGADRHRLLPDGRSLSDVAREVGTSKMQELLSAP